MMAMTGSRVTDDQPFGNLVWIKGSALEAIEMSEVNYVSSLSLVEIFHNVHDFDLSTCMRNKMLCKYKTRILLMLHYIISYSAWAATIVSVFDGIWRRFWGWFGLHGMITRAGS